jgi:predicted AAA+ superfamily ATPase
VTELLDRFALTKARRLMAATPVLVIEGARQVGKSTFAAMLVADRPHRLMTLDDADMRALLQEDPVGLLEQSPDETLVIDEAQRAGEGLLAIKAAVDRDRRPGRFVLTGSADLFDLPHNPESLAGRSMTLRLRGLSQGEIAGQPEDFVAWLVNPDTNPASFHTQWKRSDYVRAIVAGGYPEARQMSGELRQEWFDAYVNALLRQDARNIRRRIAPERLHSVLRLIAAAPAGELVKGRLAEQARIAASSITDYLDLLSTLFLTTRLPPWTANLARRETGRSKLSVSDSGLAARLTGLTENGLTPVETGQALGPLLEAFVAEELLKQRDWTAQPFTVSHLRQPGGAEIDVVLELDDGRVILLEVKTAHSYRPTQATHLRRIAEQLGDRFAGGAVLGFGDQALRIGSKLWYLPVAALWQTTVS